MTLLRCVLFHLSLARAGQCLTAAPKSVTRTIFTALSTAVLFVSPIYAAELTLAKDGRFSPEYNSQIEKLKSGDRIHLNGKSFALQRFLGEGQVTKIWDIGNGKAVRLLKRHAPVPCMEMLFEGFDNSDILPTAHTTDIYSDFANGYYRAALDLKRLEVPVIRIYAEESQPPFFTVVEKIDFETHLEDWLLTGDTGNPEMLLAWRRFLESTLGLSHIGDLKGDSIVYVPGRGWVLIDFSGPVSESGLYEEDVVYQKLRQLESDSRAKRHHRLESGR